MVDIDPILDKKFIGIPYKLGGRSFENSDCMGIILLWYKEHGIEFEYSDDIATRMKILWERRPQEFISFISGFGRFISFQEIKKYDFLMFYSDRATSVFPSLPAVMVDDRFLLSNFDKTESRAQILTLELKNRFWGAIRPHASEGKE